MKIDRGDRGNWSKLNPHQAAWIMQIRDGIERKEESSSSGWVEDNDTPSHEGGGL